MCSTRQRSSRAVGVLARIASAAFCSFRNEASIEAGSGPFQSQLATLTLGVGLAGSATPTVVLISSSFETDGVAARMATILVVARPCSSALSNIVLSFNHSYDP